MNALSTDYLNLPGDNAARAALARKLMRALPRSGPTPQEALAVLKALAVDKALEVRLALVATLADDYFLPPQLIMPLAHDTERLVAGPVLRFCMTLSDQELLELLSDTSRPWVVEEVAARKNLTNTLAAAVWQSGNEIAMATMLANQANRLSEDVIDEATEVAAIKINIQPPLVARPELTPLHIEKLAAFVEADLLPELAKRLERDDVGSARAIIGRRLAWQAERRAHADAKERASQLYAEGRLDDIAVTDSIAAGETGFVLAALALLAHIPEALAEKIVKHQSPKGITALCWRAGLAMRTCRLIQIRTARIPPPKVLLARGGFDYPLPLEEMHWYLEFYGIPTESRP